LLLFGDREAPQVKLIDFTTSMFMNNQDAGADGFSATEGWAPPEAWGDNPQISTAMDIWSLGMMLMWLQFGSGVLDCTPAQLTGTAPSAEISSLTACEQNFMDCCMRMQPAERWSAEQLLEQHTYFNQMS
jgi:serine/threonine protein kinase